MPGKSERIVLQERNRAFQREIHAQWRKMSPKERLDKSEQLQRGPKGKTSEWMMWNKFLKHQKDGDDDVYSGIELQPEKFKHRIKKVKRARPFVNFPVSN